MIRINLMPRAEARRQAARQRDKQIVTLLAAGLVLALLSCEFFTRRESNRVQEEADAYQAELADLTKRHQQATLLDKRRAQLRSKIATIDVLERQRQGPVHVLDDLSIATPEKLWLTDVRETGGGMTLTGKGLDNQTIAQFMRKLGASRYFENVDLVETKQVEEGQAKLKQFTVSARVNYAGRMAESAHAMEGGAGGSESGAAHADVPPAGGTAGTPPSNGGAAGDPGGSNQAPAQPRTFAGGAGSVETAGPLAGAVAARDAARGAAAVTERHQAAEAGE